MHSARFYKQSSTDYVMIEPSKIPVFILAGGLGTRISEETLVRPKPMIEIGGYPIILHIMRYYYSYGFNDFVVCAGYLSRMIKEYFKNYELQYDHLEIDHRGAASEEATSVRVSSVFSSNDKHQEKWRIRVLDTGASSMTGARIARAIDIIEKREDVRLSTFAVTYGDGLTDCNLDQELAFHHAHGGVGTVLGVRTVARFGELDCSDDGKVMGFLEKPAENQPLINGGYFFFNREFREYLSDDESCILEKEPLEKLSYDRLLYMYRHGGFWACMDTLRDKSHLQSLWDSGLCPWKRY
jgi:glucose-1-phosphate cytidylyltransferase